MEDVLSPVMAAAAGVNGLLRDEPDADGVTTAAKRAAVAFTPWLDDMSALRADPAHLARAARKGS